MAISKYTPQGAARYQMKPAIPDMPFQAYAAIGAQQQERKDKLFADLADTGLNLEGMKYDDPFMMEQLNEAKSEVERLANDIYTGELNTNQGIQQMYMLKSKFKNIEDSFGKLTKARKTEFEDMLKAGETASKGNAPVAELNQAIAEEQGMSTKLDLNNPTTSHLPGYDFPEIYNLEDIEKRINENLKNIADFKINPVDFQVIERHIKSNDMEGIATTLRKINPEFGKDAQEISSSLYNMMSQDQKWRDSEEHRIWADEFSKLDPNIPLNDRLDMAASNTETRLTPDVNGKNEIDKNMERILEGKGIIASRMKGGEGSETPLYLQKNPATKASKKKQDTEQSVVTYIRNSGNIAPSKDYDYMTAKNSLNKTEEILEAYETEANKINADGNKQGLDVDDIPIYNALRKDYWTSKLHQDFLTQGLYNNPNLLEEAADLVNNNYRSRNSNIAGFDFLGDDIWTSEGLTKEEWMKKNNSILQFQIKNSLNENEASFGDYLQYYTTNIIPGMYQSDAGEVYSEVLGDELKDITNEYAKANIGTYAPLLLSDSQYWPESGTKTAGAVSRFNNQLGRNIAAKPQSYNIVGAQLDGREITLQQYMADLSRSYDGIPYRVKMETDESGQEVGASVAMPMEGMANQMHVTLEPDYDKIKAMDKSLTDWEEVDILDYLTNTKGIGSATSVPGEITIPVTSKDKSFDIGYIQMADELFEQGVKNKEPQMGQMMIDDARFMVANNAIGGWFGEAMHTELNNMWMPPKARVQSSNGYTRMDYDHTSAVSEKLMLHTMNTGKKPVDIFIRKRTDVPIHIAEQGTSTVRDTKFDILDANGNILITSNSIRDAEIDYYNFLGQLGGIENYKDYTDKAIAKMRGVEE
jgi:hypothetical protein